MAAEQPGGHRAGLGQIEGDYLCEPARVPRRLVGAESETDAELLDCPRRRIRLRVPGRQRHGQRPAGDDRYLPGIGLAPGALNRCRRDSGQDRSGRHQSIAMMFVFVGVG